MNPEYSPTDIGSQLGAGGVDGVIANIEQYCAHETRRITLTNHCQIVAHKAELLLLAQQADDVADQLRDAPPPGDLRHFRRKKIFVSIITCLFSVTGFSLAVWTFAPFRLGWPGYLFCIGIATVVPFLVEQMLEGGRFEWITKGMIAVGTVAGFVSLMLLADVRGHLLAHEMQTPPAVVFEDAQPDQPAPEDNFYADTLGSLRLATVLFSFAMELAAGVALRSAWAKPPQDAKEWQRRREELATLRSRMIAIAGEITRREDESGIFEARLWRDFYGAMLTRAVQSAARKLIIALVFVAVAAYAHGATQPPPPLNLVVALDLTKSVDVKGPDGKTEFQKNIDAVTQVLANIPHGAHVTIVGITNHSFTQPYILLSVSVPEDPGYFGERQNAARRELVLAWKRRSAALQPTFTATDILGALDLASQVFREQSLSRDRRMLILFSDMRNETRELQLESQSIPGAFNQAMGAERGPDLAHVTVFALGVDGAGSSTEHWREIEQFWRMYFAKSGAALDAFATLRVLPRL